MFHHFHDDNHGAGQGSISRDDFETILDFVGLSRIIDPANWVDNMERGLLEDEHLCITFDDALLCQFDVALPVLEKHHLRAFWFVQSSVFEGIPVKFEIYRRFRSTHFRDIADFYHLFFEKVKNSEFGDQVASVLDEQAILQMMTAFPFYTRDDVHFRLIRDQGLGPHQYEQLMDELVADYDQGVQSLTQDLWLSDEHLRYLTDRGHTVGLHSYSHPMLMANLTYEEQWREYKKNYEHIQRVCGQKILAMSHPANSYNADTVRILDRLGIRLGFRSNMFLEPGESNLNTSKYEMAREDHANILALLNADEG